MIFKVKEIISIPNLITFFRIFLIFPYVSFFLGENYIVALIILAVSGISDILDGFFARKFSLATSFGAIFDPIADKLTLISVIFCIGIKFPEIIFFAVILILKDILMLIAGAFLLKRGIKPPSAKWYGKFGTTLFYILATLLVISKIFFNVKSHVFSVILFSIATITMVFVLFKYFFLFLNLIKNKK